MAQRPRACASLVLLALLYAEPLAVTWPRTSHGQGLWHRGASQPSLLVPPSHVAALPLPYLGAAFCC